MTAIECLIDRPAYPAPCTRCGEVVLIGIDGGLTVAVNPRPITTNAEIAAILTRQPTWNLIREPGIHRIWLRSRSIFQIRARAGHPVVALHSCPDGTRPCLSWQIPAARQWQPAPRITAAPDPHEKVPF